MSTATKEVDYYFKVPEASLGRLMPEERVKRGLQEINKDIFFDIASKLNLSQPFMDYHQGVYFNGRPVGKKYVCPMDRGGPLNGVLSEAPVWSCMWDMVEVHWDDVTPSELMNADVGSLMPCLHDENQVMVKRQVRGDLILIGWRATFETLIRARIPGVDRASLENKFGITLTQTPEEAELLDQAIPPWEQESAEDPEDDEVLDSMGEFEKTPVAGPWEGTK